MFTMGHYDTNQTENYRNKAYKKTGYFFTGLIGAMIGALTIGLTTPYINEIKGNTGRSPQHNEVNQVTPTTYKPEAVSNLQNMIESAKEVVVGVINYKQNTDSFNTQEQSEEAGSGSGVIYKKMAIRLLLLQIIM
ncbi:hypothetical protein ABH961_004523 [Bacillus sp. RC251]